MIVKTFCNNDMEQNIYLYYDEKSSEGVLIDASPSKTNTLIIFHEIRYNWCDYQPEGLVLAVYRWISDTLKIETPIVDINYNKTLNRYDIFFGGQI